jgi:peptide/nickel transport system permease protein
MLRYISLRVLQLIPVLVGITLLTFLLVHIAPGNPGRLFLGERASNAAVAALDRRFGFDSSLPVQYLDYLERLVHGNLGQSIAYQTAVGPLILRAIPVTLGMIALGALIACIVAVPLALLAATHRGSVADHAVRMLPLVGFGMPPFWVGFVLLFLFALTVKILPAGGYGVGFAEHLRSLILPAVTCAAITTPLLVRSLRTELIDVLDSDFIRAARAKGISPRRVLVRHALRNTLRPAVSVLAVNLGYLLGATVVVENVFDLPGLGTLLYNGVLDRDFAVVQSVALIYALFVVVLNLATDIAYAALDPRVVLD